MKFSKFEIQNFRGIKSSVLDLSKGPSNAVHVLVGLNESGKTTVLEAIDNFRSNPDLRKRNPDLRTRSDLDYQAMIPIGLRSNFDGKISIRAWLTFDDGERKKAEAQLAADLKYAEVSIPEKFTVEHSIKFEASAKKGLTNLWYMPFKVRRKKGSTPFKDLPSETPEWFAAVKVIESYLPKVMYFPAHLLEFPDRIALEIKTEKKDISPNKTNFYYAVLDDVLKAIDPKLSVETHIVKRLRTGTAPDTQNVEALVQRVEQHLNATILGEWQTLFGSSFKGKQFRLFVRIESDGVCYAAIKLSDGANLFSLNERSAGFRWFFAFSMLVKYRAHRSDQVLFLFDEPAANLHPRAQAQLLSSFAALSVKHQFLYTTHSHYLIDPLWLESTFVAKNEALEAAANPFDVDPNQASITITPYRTFVGSHQDQQFYYKPVMDALEYSHSKLAPDQASVLIEGKTDYYCLEYFKRVYYPNRYSLAHYPGGGAGTLDTLISLLSGWGVTFLVLLDSDGAANKEKARYEEKFESVVAGRIVQLAELLKRGGKPQVESMFDPVDIELLRTTFFPTQKKLSKKLLHRAIQELLASGRKLAFSQNTLDSFYTVLTALQNRHDELSKG